MCAKNKEIDPIWGHAPSTPPRSANVPFNFVTQCVYCVIPAKIATMGKSQWKLNIRTQQCARTHSRQPGNIEIELNACLIICKVWKPG